jgi:hypothetical protein
VLRGVLDWYDSKDKVYDDYRICNLVKTVYYRQNRDEYALKLLEKI